MIIEEKLSTSVMKMELSWDNKKASLISMNWLLQMDDKVPVIDWIKFDDWKNIRKSECNGGHYLNQIYYSRIIVRIKKRIMNEIWNGIRSVVTIIIMIE